MRTYLRLFVVYIILTGIVSYLNVGLLLFEEYLKHTRRVHNEDISSLVRCIYYPYRHS
jgi:hypothetical protein